MQVDGPTTKTGWSKRTWMEVVKIYLNKCNLSKDLALKQIKIENIIHVANPNIIETRIYNDEFLSLAFTQISRHSIRCGKELNVKYCFCHLAKECLLSFFVTFAAFVYFIKLQCCSYVFGFTCKHLFLLVSDFLNLLDFCNGILYHCNLIYLFCYCSSMIVSAFQTVSVPSVVFCPARILWALFLSNGFSVYNGISFLLV